MAKTYNLEIDAGAHWQSIITWKDSDNAVIPLTGYTAQMMLRRKYDDEKYLVALSSEADKGLVITEAEGLIEITITDTQTSLLYANGLDSGVYDLEITSPEGIVTRLIQGTWKVTPNVTRGLID